MGIAISVAFTVVGVTSGWWYGSFDINVHHFSEALYRPARAVQRANSDHLVGFIFVIFGDDAWCSRSDNVPGLPSVAVAVAVTVTVTVLCCDCAVL